MKEKSEKEIENENRSNRKYKTLRGLEKELRWLKKEQRACHFFLFHLITEYPLWTVPGNKKADGTNLSELSVSEKEFLGKIKFHSDTPLKQAEPEFLPLSADILEELEKRIDELPSIKNETKEDIFIEDSQRGNTNLCTKERVNNDSNVSKLPPADILFANGIANPHSEEIIKNSLYSIIYILYFTCQDDNQRLKIIDRITLLWGECRKRYPFPFAWLNSNNKEHCQWLWDEMHKRCIGVPFLARDHIQQWHFLVATFDNWKGWTMIQREYLTEKNPKRNPGKLLSGGLDPDRVEFEHKTILLDELKSAWEQKERRVRRAKEPAAVKLTKAAQKKLEYIAHVEKTIPKEILNELINNAFNDAKSKSRQS